MRCAAWSRPASRSPPTWPCCTARARKSTSTTRSQAWQEIDAAITELFLRGQREGEFRPDLTAAWLTEAFYSLVGGTAWAIRAGRAAARDFDRLITELLLNGVSPS